MVNKRISKGLTGLMLVCSILAGNVTGMRAETHSNALEPVPESVLIKHLDTEVEPRAGALPSSVDLSTSKYFPTIQNQGKVNSCAAFSTVYYQFTYEANKLNGINSKDLNNCYSPKWAYNSLNSGKNEGISMEDVYYFLRDYGALRWKDFPYDTGIRQGVSTVAREAYTDLPGKSYVDKMREALNCRATKFNTYRIQGTGTVITNNKDADLDVVKSLLINGHPLTVQVDCDWDIKLSSTWGYIIVSCASNGSGHGMTIVGYNDDVWVDVNGNNRKDPGECGAFKVANSWGVQDKESNEGYIWVLYDALNGNSSISGYKGISGKTRVPIFAKGVTDNYFMSIEVENKEVQFVAEINFSADMLNQLELSYGSSLRNSSSTKVFYQFGDYILNQPSAYNGVVLIDMEKGMNTIVTGYRGYDWNLVVSDARSDGKSIRNLGYKITDNLGQTIKNGGSVGVLDGSLKYLTASIDLMVGDVDYSGEVDSDDAVMVLQYFAGKQDFSNVQEFLGDCNGDGVVDSDDAQIILNSFAGM